MDRAYSYFDALRATFEVTGRAYISPNALQYWIQYHRGDIALFNKGTNGTVTEGQILDVLKKVQDPDLHKDIVSLGFIRNIKIENGNVAFDLNLTTPACPVKDQMRDEAVALVKGLAGGCRQVE